MKKLILFFVLAVCSLSVHGQPYSIQQYLNIKSATSPAFSPDGKHLAYLTNVTGTSQVWIVALPNGKPRQLTNYEDNVSFVKWLSDGSGIVFGKAKGGDENTQFYWMKPDGTGVRSLTNDPAVRHNFGRISADGKTIYYASNNRDRQFFDVYSMDILTGREELRYQQDGNNSVVAVNPGGSKVIVSRSGGELSLDNNLYLVDVGSKAEILLTPHTGAAEYGDADFVADGIVFTHNEGREFTGLAQLRKKNAARDDWSPENREVRIVDDAKWDIGGVAMNDYGNLIAYTVNREGVSELYLRKCETGGKPLITQIAKNSKALWVPPQGIVSGLEFSHDQSKLAYTFASANHNPEIWIYDLKTGISNQITHSDLAGVSDTTLISPRLIRFKSFDGREISAWYYEPPRRSFTTIARGSGNRKLRSTTTEPIPVIVSVHGGPEGQERPGFNPLYQYYLSRGYGILAPNVRGSTGFGKTFTHLDDVKKREDSVKDLAASVEWLKTKGGADPRRIAVMGGSYGGYMTLAAITLYPELWAAAVDTVGISNWESFLKNTSGYRRRQREVEYGRLDRDLDFLRSISPIAKIDRIKCPLFVIAGKNDPRVPWTEGEQMVNALKKRGAIVQWRLYDDEGHGISKLKNRLELYPLVADFLDKYMK